MDFIKMYVHVPVPTTFGRCAILSQKSSFSYSLVTSPRFATSGRGAVITVWEAVLEEGAGTRLVSRSTLKGHASTVTAIHFSGEDVVTADKDGVMKLWKIFRGGEGTRKNFFLSLP